MSLKDPVTGDAALRGVERATLGQLLAYTEGRPIQRVVPIIYSIASELDVDPAFAVAEAILESGWGTSNFACTRHNWYGYQAYYEDSAQARRFATDEDGIRAALEAMARNYFAPGGTHFAGGAGATLKGWARHWIDGGPENWQRGVRTLMRIMQGIVNSPDSE